MEDGSMALRTRATTFDELRKEIEAALPRIPRPFAIFVHTRENGYKFFEPDSSFPNGVLPAPIVTSDGHTEPLEIQVVKMDGESAGIRTWFDKR
jgi:hypothetical protein